MRKLKEKLSQKFIYSMLRSYCLLLEFDFEDILTFIETDEI